MDTKARQHPAIAKMVASLVAAAGDRLTSVVLYGSAARGDFNASVSDFNLLVVVADVELSTLERLSKPFDEWRRAGQPMPRVFALPMLTESADVFPIEFLEIQQRHVVLAGRDPFEGVAVGMDYLRLQCERELREKLLRLEEGYIEAFAHEKELKRLLVESYSVFAAIFRGCLRLLGGEPPVATHDVVSHFCARAGLDVTPFQDIERLRQGERSAGPAKPLFARYYAELTKAVSRVNAFA